MTRHPIAWLRALRQRLIRDRQGIAATEFALMAPFFMLFIMAMFDLAHMAYARAVFEGAVDRAARLGALETADVEEADAMIESLVRPVLPNMVLRTDRKSYYDQPDLRRAEEFTDTNENDTCDNGEAFVDENRSGEWESDIGVAGNGGSSDVVLFVAEATYTPVFTVPFIPNSWSERTLTATAVKKNQPFGNQLEYATTAGTCTD